MKKAPPTPDVNASAPRPKRISDEGPAVPTMDAPPEAASDTATSFDRGTAATDQDYRSGLLPGSDDFTAREQTDGQLEDQAEDQAEDQLEGSDDDAVDDLDRTGSMEDDRFRSRKERYPQEDAQSSQQENPHEEHMFEQPGNPNHEPVYEPQHETLGTVKPPAQEVDRSAREQVGEGAAPAPSGDIDAKPGMENRDVRDARAIDRGLGPAMDRLGDDDPTIDKDMGEGSPYDRS